MWTPTSEQQAIVMAAKETSSNLLISALAGAAKTSTLVLIAQALSSTPILCLAFNKKIQMEMKNRLPGNCEAMTLNSLGHRAWSSFTGKRLVVNQSKTYDILSSLIQDLDPADRSAAYESLSEMIKWVDSGKTAGYIPDGHFPMAKGLMNDQEYFAWLDEEPTPLQEQLLKAAAVTSISQAMRGTIDYNDQVFLPAVFPCSFPSYPLILVDEAQDLSALNHVVLKKLTKKRIIAVGDERQAIYGFRGAHEDSMNLLAQTFRMEELLLSISFRCPQEVVKACWWRAPHMKWADQAQEGLVKSHGEWTLDALPDNAVILCRNNAPLFSMAIRLLKAGRYPELVGNDIGKALLKIMSKLGPSSTPISEAHQLLEEWAERKRSKSRDPAKINDQKECIEVFLEHGKSLGDAIAYAEHLFRSSGPIKLMTGHKSKGLEFPEVFILDKSILTLERGQDKNLLYVMQSRAMRKLHYVESSLLQGA